MKRVCFFLLMTLMGFGLYAQTVSHNDWQSLKVDFTMPELRVDSAVVDGTTYTVLSVDGYYPSDRVGAPDLPRFSSLIEVPLCDGFVVTVSGAVYDTVDLPQHWMMPAQPSPSKSETTHRFVIDRSFYAADTFFRAMDLAAVSAVGIARDRSLALLQFAPLAYNPVSHQMVVCRKATVTVQYVGADEEASRSMFERYHSPLFSSGTMSLNSLYPKTGSATAPIRYTIVAHSSFRGQLDEFAAWKRRKGFMVDLVYTDDAAVGTTTTSIASYINGLYTNATTASPAPTYLLLVGDHEQIPAFTGSTDSDHITDLYYVSWTSTDHIPDCYTGRFSAQTVAQLTPQVEKTLMYEQYTFADPSFLDRAVMVAGVDGGTSGDYGYTHADPAMDYAITNYINGTQGFTQVKYYKNDPSIVPTASNVTINATGSSATSSCLADYNQGAGWINYSAHGSATGWYLPSLSTSTVSSMSNSQKFGVMIGNCCLTNHFQTTTCLGESLLRRGNYSGAVGYIGGTNSTYWYEDVYWAVGVRSSSSISPTMSMAYDNQRMGMYDRLCHTHNESYSQWAMSQGSMVFLGNMAVESSTSGRKHYYWEIYELMGDPSLMPYLTQASTMTLTASSSVQVGASTLAVTAAPYAYVAMTDTTTGTLVAAAFANASGSATLTLPTALQVGNYEIAASAQQYKTAFRSVSVLPASGPFPQVMQMVSQSDMVAGDTVTLNVEISNIGNATASQVLVDLACNNSLVTLGTQSLTIESLTVGSSVTLPVTAYIDPSAPDASQVVVSATVSCNQMTSSSYYSNTFTLQAPVLTVETSFSPASLLPGGEVIYDVTVTNSGHAALPVSQLSMTSPSSDLTVTAVGSTSFSLAVGASVTRQFSVGASISANTGATLPLIIAISGDVTLTDTVEIYIGENLTETFDNGSFSLDGWTQGSYPWQVDATMSYSGSYSARSNSSLTHSQTSDLTISVNVAHSDSISFYYKVSSESNYDKFHFYIDNTEQLVASGQVDWTRAAYPVTAGSHTFRFSYSKDVSVSNYSDCAWIDDVQLPHPVQTFVVAIVANHGTAVGAGTYQQGDTAVVGVMPQSGYAFIGWNDGNNENPRQLVINSNYQLVATLLQEGDIDTVTQYIMQTDTMVVTDTVTIVNQVNVYLHDTTYVDVPYAVHDTTYIDNYIHDTTLIVNTVYDTTYIDVPYAVHDTTYINNYIYDTTVIVNTVYDTTYVDVPYAVHDTTYIDNYIYDTTVIVNTVYDTAYIDVPYAIHDTTYIDNYIYDTTIIVKTVYDTTYVDVPYAVHDTTYIDNYIYDTTIVVNTVYDTTYVDVPYAVHDTTYIDNYIYDTTIIVNTVYDTTYVDVPYAVHDTTYIEVVVHDTTEVVIPLYDTTYINVPYSVHDTTYINNYIYDTTVIVNTVYDTTYIDVPYAVHDTTYINNYIYDTTYITQLDTVFVDVFVHDTVVVTDTVTVELEMFSLSVVSANMNQGLVAGSGVFPEGTEVEIAAIPLEGFRFDRWDDGSTENPRRVTLDGDMSFMASFGQVGTEAVMPYNFQVYASHDVIVVENAEGNRVRIFDAVGRILCSEGSVTESLRFQVPVSGVYMVQVGDYPARRLVIVK